MTNQEIVEELSSLVHLDLDAVLAYDRALEAIGDGGLATELARFKLDHQRHVLELSRVLLDRNVKPPAARPDVKGTILGGVTGVRARLGTEQALKAMVPNEELATSTYARSLAKPFPHDALDVVRRCYDDEQRHLAWIQRAIDQRLWEGDRDSTFGAGI
jgi:rubrerythrin